MGWVILSAKAEGVTRSITITTQLTAPQPQLSCSSGTIISGGSAQCTVTLPQGAPAGEVVLGLTSSSSHLRLPASVRVAAGERSAQFRVDVTAANQDEQASLRATVDGSTAATTIAIAALKPVALSCQPGYIVAGQNAVCEIRLNGAASDDSTTVSLSSDTGSLKIPAVAGAYAGQSRIRFEAVVAPTVTQSTAVLSAQTGGAVVQTTVILQATDVPTLIVPGKQTGKPGSAFSFTVTASDSNNLSLPVSATNLPSGSHFDAATGIFEWQPAETDLGHRDITFAATAPTGGSSRKTVALYVGTGLPVITALENAANSSAAAVCSPGSVAAIAGHSLFTGTAPLSEYSGAVTELNGTQVLVNGIPAPLLYASADRLTFLCPAAELGESLRIAVETPAGTSNAIRSPIAETAPGLFTIDSSKGSEAAATSADSGDLSLVPNFLQPGRPVLPGAALTVRATGIDCGAASTTRLRLKVGQQEVPIDSLRPAAHYAGVCEIAITTPNSSGDAVPLVLEVTRGNGQLLFSNTATVAIGSRD
jgi:uncharacterized protein (TIGR03437 family)